ncbi:hypothetical protein J1N35_033966 [Gossypium stocksii]|uniref:Uncharacterized protein n=1 Tax=Gossypium stocksii TaxID=47602 RepID=A0A9D3URF6_9ROSI|nr:hypothetical protein J1N35_033966 [Gossypium stocksii]
MKHNKILACKNKDGECVFEDEVLQSEDIKFFQKLYGEISDRMTTLPANLFPKLDLHDVLFLIGRTSRSSSCLPSPHFGNITSYDG